MRRLLDHRGDVVSVFHSFADDEVAVETKQDCEPILDENRVARSLGNQSSDWGLRRVASIPSVIYEQWLKEGMPAHDKAERMRFIRRKLQDPNWKNLLTDEKGV